MCRTRQNTRKYIIGFQSTLLFSALQNGGIVGNPSRQFIQILHTANNHWLTVSNLFCRTNEVCLYDSLSTDLDNKDKPAQASWRPIFLVMYPDVQQQTNFSNCGLFTIACAFALCCNIRPESCMFCEGRMSFRTGKVQFKIEPRQSDTRLRQLSVQDCTQHWGYGGRLFVPRVVSSQPSPDTCVTRL